MTQKKPQQGLGSPKGMRDIIGDEYYRYQGLFEKAQEIAVYYGFRPIETPILEHEELFVRGVGEHTDIVEKEMYALRTKGGDHLVMRPEGTAPSVRAYIEHGMHTIPQPVMLYYGGPFFRHENPQRGRLRELRQFGVEVLGTQKSIADALVIRTLLDILEEAGLKNLSIDINSMGDSDSRPGYVRALVNHYKKHVDALCPNCRERIKSNPLRLLDCKDERCAALKADAPDSVSFLSHAGKQHFKEVLEYLDSLNITYTINPTLVRGLDYYTHTVFEIIAGNEETERTEKKSDDTEETTDKKDLHDTPEKSMAGLAIASGGRYDNLAKLIGAKKSVPAVGGAIGLDRVLMMPGVKAPAPRIMKKPKVYFIQIGFEAKLKSLSVIEVLRKARIPIIQSLSKDSLSAQLAIAEKTGVPHVIIFGQKEALDQTVIVRNMENRSQDTVKLDKLSEYLKNIK